MLGALASLAIPAAIGGLSYMASRSGQPERVQQTPTLNPQQLALQTRLGNYAADRLMNNQLDFSPIEARARQQFKTQTIPGLAERFTAMGGGQRSSAFQSALGSASSDLESNLGALRSQYNLAQYPQLLSMMNIGMRPQFENVFRPEQASGLESLLSGLGSGASHIAAAGAQGYMSNPENVQKLMEFLSSILGYAA